MTETAPHPDDLRLNRARTARRAATVGLVILGLAGAVWGSAWAVVVAVSGLAGLGWQANRSVPARRGFPKSNADPEAGAAMDDPLHLALDALPDPVLIVEAGARDDVGSRRIRHANPAARRMMGVAPQGQPLTAAMRDPDVLDAVEESLFADATRDIGYETGGSQTRHWRAWSAPLPRSDAGPPRAVLRLRDETESRRAEMMRADFLANASHELRTPLASLSGFVETLKGHARDDARARDRFLDIMTVQTERMGRLVADLLALSRIELNEHVPPSDRVDLRLVVGEVCAVSGVLMERKQLRFELDSDDGPVWVRGDRDQLIQVTQNLVDNAVKYSPPGAAVRISLVRSLTAAAAAGWSAGGLARISLLSPDRSDDTLYALLCVRDSGDGMRREHMPRLTERFYRVEGQKSGEHPGTGLGLAIVKHIVNRHHGGLTVESEPGAGAAFCAYFPLADENRPQA